MCKQLVDTMDGCRWVQVHARGGGYCLMMDDCEQEGSVRFMHACICMHATVLVLKAKDARFCFVRWVGR